MELAGRTILVTRAAHASAEFVRAIEARGGRALLFPMIEIAPPLSWEGCDRAIGRLAEYDGLLFASANGVEGFFHRLSALGAPASAPAAPAVYAVGQRTKDAAEHHGLAVRCIPERYTAADLVAALSSEEVKGKRFLFPRGNLGSATLSGGLEERGAVVDVVEVYQTIEPEPEDVARMTERLLAGEVDVVTFASPSAARHFAALFPGETMGTIARLSAFAAIGPVTASALAHLGLKPQVVAPESTMEAMLEAILRYVNSTDTTPPHRTQP